MGTFRLKTTAKAEEQDRGGYWLHCTPPPLHRSIVVDRECVLSGMTWHSRVFWKEHKEDWEGIRLITQNVC